MLREVKNKHIKPRLVPFTITTSVGSGAVISVGGGEISATRTASGRGAIAPKIPFSRNGVMLLAQSSNDGGTAATSLASGSGSSFTYQITDKNAASFQDGPFSGFLFGWDSSDLSLCKAQRASCSFNSPRIIWGKITGASGVVAFGKSDFTCTRTAAGSYTIGFTRGFGRIPVVMATAAASGAASTTNTGSVAASGCTVTTAPQTGTKTDADFYICVIGQDSRSDAGKVRRPLQNSQRKPRIIACEVTNDGSHNFTLTMGGATGGADFTTLTSNGAGDFSITIAEPFAREPAIFVTSRNAKAQVVSIAGNVINIQTRSASTGSVADLAGVTHVLVIGSDDASEY